MISNKRRRLAGALGPDDHYTGGGRQHRLAADPAPVSVRLALELVQVAVGIFASVEFRKCGFHRLGYRRGNKCLELTRFR